MLSCGHGSKQHLFINTGKKRRVVVDDDEFTTKLSGKKNKRKQEREEQSAVGKTPLRDPLVLSLIIKQYLRAWMPPSCTFNAINSSSGSKHTG